MFLNELAIDNIFQKPFNLKKFLKIFLVKKYFSIYFFRKKATLKFTFSVELSCQENFNIYHAKNKRTQNELLINTLVVVSAAFITTSIYLKKNSFYSFISLLFFYT